MTVRLHAGLVSGRWQALTLLEQLANIGSEVGRAALAKANGNDQRLAAAMDRCLELFELTLADERWHGRRREIARAQEVVCDFLVGDNAFGSTAESLDRYFLPFAVAARESRPAPPILDRSEIRRAIRMSDAQREAYFLASNRNMLRMFEDARRSG
jgi:hypothetical protein